MKRNIELERKILLKIEEVYKPGQKYIDGLDIKGYDVKLIAEHCDFLYQKGFIVYYKPIFSHSSGISQFTLGNLSVFGFEYLETVRNDAVWDKTVQVIEERKLPKTIEFVAEIAGKIAGSAAKEFFDVP